MNNRDNKECFDQNHSCLNPDPKVLSQTPCLLLH